MHVNIFLVNLIAADTTSQSRDTNVKIHVQVHFTIALQFLR